MSQSHLPPFSTTPFTTPADTAGQEFYVHVPADDTVPPANLPAPCGDENAAADPVKSDDRPEQAEEMTAITRAGYFRIKSGVDRIITLGLTVIALPLMLLVGLAILLTEGRPVFYRQIRLGKGGREFWIWKFRTMRRDAESKTGAVWCSTGDPRITPLGRWLRCSHVDELPQFFNILAGHMNLIGPRPERPELARQLDREIAGYMNRTRVRPGITGLAQLRLGYDHSVADVRKKVRMDLQYIRTATLHGDVWLLFCTMPYVVKQLYWKWITSRKAEGSARQTAVDQPVSPADAVQTIRCDAPNDRRRGISQTRDGVAPMASPIDQPRDECA